MAEAAAEASAEEEDQGATEATAKGGAGATGSKNNMAKQRKPGLKTKKAAPPRKGKRRKQLGSVVWAYPRRPALVLSYSPCPHIYFRHSLARRSKLNQKRYDELLATPKSEPWKEPEEELQKFRRRLITPRTECLALPPKRKMKAQLDEFSDILTPQMVENLVTLLKTECELPVEDVSHAKGKDKAKKKAAKKTKKKKQVKKKPVVKKGTGARRAVPAAKGVKKKQKTGELEGEEEQADEEEDEAEVEAEAATEEETEGGEETEAEEEETEAEEVAEGEGETGEGGEGGAEAGAEEGLDEEEEGEEGEVEGVEEEEEEEAGEGEEGEEEAEAEAPEKKKLTGSQLKLQEASRPIKEYAAWLQESLSKASLWADWIGSTVEEAQAKAAKKKGAVLEKDGTPKKLTCKEWKAWKDQLKTNVKDWQSTKQDILQSAKMWEKFMQIRADKIKAGESFTVPNPQAYQKSFGKLSSPRVSKS